MIINKTSTSNLMIKLIIILSMGLSFNANAGSEFDTAWAAAEDLRLLAAEARNEWRKTADILDQAKAEYAAGNKDAAMALVVKAHEESVDALAQAEREKTAWQARVIK